MGLKDLTGQRFGRLLVIERNPINSNDGHVRWDCLCDSEYEGCGKTVPITSNVLKKGTTVSCGCYKRELSTKHGMHGCPEYSIWKGIKQRCYNEKHHKYKAYGSRGIAMCEEWLCDFEAFYRDMGPRPSPEHSIERKDNNKGYSKENCEWATRLVQANNTRRNVFYLYNGKCRTVANWHRELDLDKLGISVHLIHGRLKSGWSFEKAITTSPNKAT